MALHPPTIHRADVRRDLLITLGIVAAAIILMVVATAVFGWHATGVSLEIPPDPIGGLHF